MNTETNSRFQRSWIHDAILVLSAVLIGIYSVRPLPVGLAHTVFQTGIVGMIAFLGLGHAAALRRATAEKSQAQANVECRLDRHVDGSLRRIDAEVETSPPGPNAITDRIPRMLPYQTT